MIKDMYVKHLNFSKNFRVWGLGFKPVLYTPDH